MTGDVIQRLACRNNEKRARLPAEWIQKHLPVEESRTNYIEMQLLDLLPEDIRKFKAFYDTRRALMKLRIEKML